MKLRSIGWWFAGALVLGGAAAAIQVARSPLSFYETYHMLRLGLRATLQEEPDYDQVEAALIETGAAAGEPAREPSPDDDTAPTWTDFRGPGRLGIYSETPIRTDWPPQGLPLVWRRPAGASYGSVTVADGLVFSLEQRRERETLVAYGLDTGAEIWSAGWEGHFEEGTSGEGPRSTPVWALDQEGRGVVYALGALGSLRSFDAETGTPGWSVDLLKLAPAENLLYGLTGSPLVHAQRLIVPTGAPTDGKGCLLALERRDGALAWRAIDDAPAYSSPLLVTLGGREQLLFSSAKLLSALDPESGAELWNFPWQVTSELTCSQPVAIDDRHVLLSAGYGKGSALVQVDFDGNHWTTAEVWRSARFKTRFNPAVLHQGLVYGLDEGVLACLDPLDGRRVWKGGRYGLGQLLLAGEHLLVLDEDGALALVRAGPEGWDELGSFQALEGLTLNIPAAAHGRLIVRNKLEIACYLLN